MPSQSKKFIAVFLLLAIAGSSAAFFFASPGTALTPAAPKTAEGGSPQTPTNAFGPVFDLSVEPIPEARGTESVASAVPDGSLDAGIPPASGTNLTEELVRALGLEIAKTSAEEPADAAAGLAAPDIQSIANSIIVSRSAATRVPDWEAEVNRQRITVLTKYTTEDVNAYNKRVNELMQNYLAAAGGSGGFDLDGSSYAGIDFAGAHTEGMAIVVPEPLAGFHWSLLKLFAYQAKAVELAQVAETDPVRASLIFQAQEQNYSAAIQLLVNESQKRSDIRGISAEKLPTIAAFLSAALGVQTAHAQWLVVDPIKIARMVWEWLKMFVTEKLKDLLVHKLVQQTIRWIQGGGKPQFITDWKGFLFDTAKDVASRVIDDLYPGLCEPFGPLIKVAVLPVNLSRDFDARPACTINTVVQNVKAFAESFKNGGWIAYGAALEPSNNFFGSLFQIGDILQLEASEGQEAGKDDAESSSGFLSSRECVEYGPKTVDPEGFYVRGPCLEWRNTTPGEALVGAIKDSFAAPLLRIVNAQDLAALINALINAVLSKLVKLGQSTVSKGLLGLDMSTYETSANSCEGLTGNDLADCQRGWQDVNCTEVNVVAPISVSVSGDATNPDGSTSPVSGTGSGSITFPNGANCTGGPTDGGGGGGGDSGGTCASENCNPFECLCKTRDGLTTAAFCYLDDVVAAQDAVLADFNAGAIGTGLIAGPFGSCTASVCVQDGTAYSNAVARKLRSSGLTVSVGEEVCVTGTCDAPACSAGSPADCPAALQHEPGFCVPPGNRTECTDISSSAGFIRKWIPNSVCPG